MGKAV